MLPAVADKMLMQLINVPSRKKTLWGRWWFVISFSYIEVVLEAYLGFHLPEAKVTMVIYYQPLT